MFLHLFKYCRHRSANFGSQRFSIVHLTTNIVSKAFLTDNVYYMLPFCQRKIRNEVSPDNITLPVPRGVLSHWQCQTHVIRWATISRNIPKKTFQPSAPVIFRPSVNRLSFSWKCNHLVEITPSPRHRLTGI